jgi:NAD(P)-dependent dehydrogenase (short-subunit alcohol dehydrogenase family)
VDGLAGRVVLVTGATSGIGRATCERLGREGAHVAVVGRRAEVGMALAAAISGAGPGRAEFVEADVRDEAAVVTAVERIAERIGPITGVVTAAGASDIAGDMRDIADVSLESFSGVLATNLIGTFLIAKHTLPVLANPRSTTTALVTISSTGGLRGHGMGPGYTASKGGVISLTRLLAVQYGSRGVRVNCVCPGPTHTEGMGAVFADAEVARRTARAIPLGRVGRAEEVAALATFLLSDDASYLSGLVITADGGATAL